MWKPPKKQWEGLWSSAAFGPSEPDVVFRQHPEKTKETKHFYSEAGVSLLWLYFYFLFLSLHFGFTETRVSCFFVFFYVFHRYAFEVPVVIFNAMATCSQPFLDPLVSLS